MAAQSHDVYARLAGLGRMVPAEDKPAFQDVAEQFGRLRNVSDGEKEFLIGVIDLYQTRVATKMTVAVERLAVLAAVTLPITALASIYGMNVIVNDRTNLPQLFLVLAVMLLHQRHSPALDEASGLVVSGERQLQPGVPRRVARHGLQPAHGQPGVPRL